MPKNVLDDQILTATLDAIAEHGYDGATTRRIADAAHINEVTLFRRFGNKTNLVLAAVRQEVIAFKEADICYSGDVEADLRRVVQFYTEIFRTRGKIAPVILAELPRHPELQTGLHEVFEILGAIMAMITQYQAEGALVKEPPFQTLGALLGPVLVTSVVSGLETGKLSEEVDPSTCVRLFLQGRRINM